MKIKVLKTYENLATHLWQEYDIVARRIGDDSFIVQHCKPSGLTPSVEFMSEEEFTERYFLELL